MAAILGSEVTPEHRVWSRLTERFVTVTDVRPTGRKAMGTDTPMLRIGLGPDARPAKAIEMPADQTIEVE